MLLNCIHALKSCMFNRSRIISWLLYTTTKKTRSINLTDLTKPVPARNIYMK